VHFCVFNGNILVGPCVDKTTYVFKISYTQEPATAVTSATSSVPFSDKYRKCLRYGTLQLLYESLENYEEAGIWEGKYEKDLLKIIINDRANSADSLGLSYNGV
jgi:hypothetical protein